MKLTVYGNGPKAHGPNIGFSFHNLVLPTMPKIIWTLLNLKMGSELSQTKFLYLPVFQHQITLVIT